MGWQRVWGHAPDTLAGDLGGGLPAQFGMRSNFVVFLPPWCQHEPGHKNPGRGGGKNQHRAGLGFNPQTRLLHLRQIVGINRDLPPEFWTVLSWNFPLMIP